MIKFHTAAWAIGLEKLCLTKLKQLGGVGTARDVATALGKDMGLISPRFSALASQGKVRDTGRRESHGKGRPLKVWSVCDGAPTVTYQAKPRNPENDAPAWFKNYGN